MAPKLKHQPLPAICSWCKAEKPHYRSKLGTVVRICIDCRAEAARAPEFRAKKRASYRDNLPRQLLDHAKGAARRKGLIFDLTAEDIYVPETCPVFGTRLEVGSGIRTENSPSLDRIIPSRGYVRGNVWVISWRANRIKNDASLDELKLVIEALARRLGVVE